MPSIVTRQVLVGDVAVQLAAASAGRTEVRLRWPLIQNQVPPAVGGSSSVTQSNGYRPILSSSSSNGSQEYTIPTDGEVWAVCIAGQPLTIDVLELVAGSPS